MFIQVGNSSALGDDIMVRLEGKLHLLMALMKVECDVEMGESMKAV